MPASTRMWMVSARWAGLAGIIAWAAAGCARNSVGVAYGYGSQGPAPFDGGGPPALAASGTLPQDSARLPVALRAAAVLEAQGWPVISADSASGVLISDWQYFEPSMPNQPAINPCGRAIALRLTVRPHPRDPHAVLLTEQVALRTVGGPVVPGYARMIFRDLFEAIKAAPEPSAGPLPENKAWVTLTRNLRTGEFRMCMGGAT